MRAMNCPRCGAYIQGDYKRLDVLPTHLTALADDMELVPCEPNDPDRCIASEHLVPTEASEKDNDQPKVPLGDKNAVEGVQGEELGVI